jgi:hypothetical protein
MAAFNKSNAFVEDVCEKIHNLGADSLKIMLTNVAPVAGNSVKADLTEIASGNGYTAGGSAVTISSSAQTAGLYKLILADLVFVASGGLMATFRYAVLYNSTPVAGPLIGWWDRGTTLTLQSGDSATIDFDNVNGVLQLT